MNRTNFKKEMYERGEVLFIGEMSPETKEELERELSYISECHLEPFFERLDALASRIDKLEYSIIYSGFMVDSVVAYLLGLSNIELATFENRTREEKNANFYVSSSILENLINYLENLYGKTIIIEEQEDIPQYTERVVSFKFADTDIVLNLVVTTFPYQDIVDNLRSRTKNYYFSFDDKKIWSLVHHELDQKELMPEIQSALTKSTLLYILNYFKMHYEREYYKTIVEWTFYYFGSVEEIERQIAKATLPTNSYLMAIIKKMYEEGYRLSNEDEHIYLNKENYKEEVFPLL